MELNGLQQGAAITGPDLDLYVRRNLSTVVRSFDKEHTTNGYIVIPLVSVDGVQQL